MGAFQIVASVSRRGLHRPKIGGHYLEHYHIPLPGPKCLKPTLQLPVTFVDSLLTKSECDLKLLL